MDKTIIDQSATGERLDKYAQALTNLTRSRVASLITSGDILVNGKTSKAGYALRIGDSISIALPELSPIEAMPQNIPLDILFEDDHIVIVNKAKGMVVHPAPGHMDNTLVNALLYHCGGSLSGINGAARPGIVHRIDKDTSGILVVAKNDQAHNGLALQFAEHSIDREYIAIAHGKLKRTKDTIEAPIARHKINRKKMAVMTDGKRAVTHYDVIEQFARHALIKAKLETGRTHQIRVHMSHIGHPLLGDEVYGSSKQHLGSVGQALHAGLLGFIHPITKERALFETPPPPCFSQLVTKVTNLK